MHNSGSTLIAHAIRRCKNAGVFDNHFCEASSLPEFRGNAPNLRSRIERPDPLKYNWFNIRRLMLAQWPPNKLVLFDKSPVHGLFNADEYTKFGEHVNFIVLMRNPYAYCEGVKRRMKEQQLLVSVKDAANFWLECARRQIQNFSSAESALCITYEWLCANPDIAEEVFRDFMPELDDFSLSGEWGVGSISNKPWETQPLASRNDRQISALSREEVETISSVLRSDPIPVHYFEYEII